MNYYDVLTGDILPIVITHLRANDLLCMRATCRSWEENPRLYAQIHAGDPHVVMRALYVSTADVPPHRRYVRHIAHPQCQMRRRVNHTRAEGAAITQAIPCALLPSDDKSE